MAQTATQEQPKKEAPIVTLANLILAKKSTFQAVATAHLSPERLVKLGQAMLTRTPKLLECAKTIQGQTSLIVALTKCSQLGLEPNEPGGIWIVPFDHKDKKTGQVLYTEAQTIIDYRGAIDVARRSGQIAAVHADVVRANDHFKPPKVSTASPVLVEFEHQPAEGERGEIRGAYAVAKLANGQAHVSYLTLAEVSAYRNRSRAKDSGPWQSDWNAMACKTACRRMVNLLPKTPEIQKLREALAEEEAIDAGEQVLALPPAGKAEAIKAKLAEKNGKPAPDHQEHAGEDEGPPPDAGSESEREDIDF